MNSLYLHIPYCISRCAYCDFHSSTCLDDKTQYIDALCMELKQRKDYLSSTPLETIYFGGGTPSLLSPAQLKKIFRQIHRCFEVDAQAEITLEANPNDLNIEYLSELKAIGFNRLSIGIQSFSDTDLKLINRRHTAQEAKDAVTMAQEVGFNNISIDLIFALPLQTLEAWQSNLQQAFALGIQHISSYHLMFEQGTDFYRKKEQGLISEMDEESSLAMFQALIDQAQTHHFIHYETSNFALDGYFSKHNSNYWRGSAYLGIGAGAHSFNGDSRRWNVADNKAYVAGILSNTPLFDLEIIDNTTAYNEFILTGLRTMWGCGLDVLMQRFGKEMLNYCLKAAQVYVDQQQLVIENNTLLIAPKALFISDQIMSDLMYIDNKKY